MRGPFSSSIEDRPDKQKLARALKFRSRLFHSLDNRSNLTSVAFCLVYTYDANTSISTSISTRVFTRAISISSAFKFLSTLHYSIWRIARALLRLRYPGLHERCNDESISAGHKKKEIFSCACVFVCACACRFTRMFLVLLCLRRTRCKPGFIDDEL